MDQVELLVYKHQIKDNNILNILKHLNNVTDLDLKSKDNYCFSAINLAEQNRKYNSNNKEYRKYQTLSKKKEAFIWKSNSLDKNIESEMTNDNIQKLEKLMKLFRADQLYAPVIHHFNNTILNYRRNFFVNLRFMAKMAPFKKIKNVVENLYLRRLRDGFSSIIFFTRPHLKLLLLIYVISKVKQRRLMDSFRRLEGYKKFKKKVPRDIIIQPHFRKKYESSKENNPKQDYISIMKQTLSSLSPKSMLTDYSHLKTETDSTKLKKILSNPESIVSTMNYESNKKLKDKRGSIIRNFLREIKDLQANKNILNFEYGYNLSKKASFSQSLQKFGPCENKMSYIGKRLIIII